MEQTTQIEPEDTLNRIRAAVAQAQEQGITIRPWVTGLVVKDGAFQARTEVSSSRSCCPLSTVVLGQANPNPELYSGCYVTFDDLDSLLQAYLGVDSRWVGGFIGGFDRPKSGSPEGATPAAAAGFVAGRTLRRELGYEDA